MQTRTSSRRAASSAPAPAPAVHQNYEAVSCGNLEVLIRLRKVPGGCGRNLDKSGLIERLRKEALTPEGAKMAVEFPASRFDNETGTTVSVTRTSGAHAANTFFRSLLELRGEGPLEEWPAGSFNKNGDLGDAVSEFSPMALPTLTRWDCSRVRKETSKVLGRPAAWYDAKNYYADGAVHVVDWLKQNESDGVSRIVLPRAESLLRKIEALAEPVVGETKDVACARCDHCRLFARTFPGHVGTLAKQASNVKKPSKIRWTKPKRGAGFVATFQCTAAPRAQERLSDDTISDLRFHATCKDAALLCRNFLVEVVAALDDTKLQEYAAAAIELKHSHQYLGDRVRDVSKAVAAALKAGRSRGWETVKHSEINDHTIPMRKVRDAEGVFEPTSDDLLAWGKR